MIARFSKLGAPGGRIPYSDTYRVRGSLSPLLYPSSQTILASFLRNCSLTRLTFLQQAPMIAFDRAKTAMPLFEVIAGVASMLGLVASAGALWQARKASRAASQARDSALANTLAGELEAAADGAGTLLDYLKQRRNTEAGLIAHQLVGRLSEIPFRRHRFLDEPGKSQLLNARTQIDIIGEELARIRAATASDDNQQRLIVACQRTYIKLKEHAGKIRGIMDVGAKQ